MSEGRRTRSIIGGLIGGAVLLPAVCWVLLGMPPLQALLIGALACVAIGIIRFPPDGYGDDFPEPPTPERDRGARREVFRLSWNVAGRQDRVGSTLITRLQQIAGRRLADHGLRLDDPADRDRVIELVGAPSYRLLTLPPGSETGTRSFTAALSAVERLPALPPPVPHAYGHTTGPQTPLEQPRSKENR